MHRVGIIYPGEPAAETELATLEPWLRHRGVANVSVVFVCSRSDGAHDLASLECTGALGVLVEAAKSLKGCDCSAGVWACTSGSFIAGLAGAHRQISTIAEVLAVPATSTSFALGRAARWLSRSRVEVLSPYPAEIGASFIAFLAEFGVAVSAVSHLNAATGGDSRRLNVYDEVKRHEALHGRTGVPLLIPDTAIDTLDLVADLEETFGRVVVTANQATVWDLLRLAGCAAVLDNAGVLFGSRPLESSSC